MRFLLGPSTFYMAFLSVETKLHISRLGYSCSRHGNTTDDHTPRYRKSICNDRMETIPWSNSFRSQDNGSQSSGCLDATHSSCSMAWRLVPCRLGCLTPERSLRDVLRAWSARYTMHQVTKVRDVDRQNVAG